MTMIKREDSADDAIITPLKIKLHNKKERKRRKTVHLPLTVYNEL